MYKPGAGAGSSGVMVSISSTAAGSISMALNLMDEEEEVLIGAKAVAAERAARAITVRIILDVITFFTTLRAMN